LIFLNLTNGIYHIKELEQKEPNRIRLKYF
jgi:hypothetical protein